MRQLSTNSNIDVVEFGGYTVTDLRNGDLFVKVGDAEIRISCNFEAIHVTAGPGLTLEPTSVNGRPAFRTRKRS